ncbi:MAG TPA: N-acetylmuramoyl-L-alanine amidase-like domain-containing protein [Robiginitalea sp.]|nr:N-acetylmuramoyl-L-alanine amidase-like domain-containing protein [Robiginitalea sp.]
MRFWIFASLLLVGTGLHAQGRVLATQHDKAIFQALTTGLREQPDTAMGPMMIRVGRSFLGTPYVAQTLEQGPEEQLVVNLRGLDCTTYVENVLVLSRLARKGKLSWERYLEGLEEVRYRHGKLDGYPSRLHYFTEWIRDNEAKGLVRDITEQIYGVTFRKDINFMGTHRNLYPMLASETNYKAIRQTESSLSQKRICVLPQQEVAARESLLQDGDIIALATDIEGLDVTHTGIALRLEDNRIHLLHASTAGEVLISEQPLAEYLTGIRRNTGIIVVRPRSAE